MEDQEAAAKPDSVGGEFSEMFQPDGKDDNGSSPKDQNLFSLRLPLKAGRS